LGMNLLTNDESGLLKVVDFPRGSQARVVCERRNLDPAIFEGAAVIAVNGFEYVNAAELFDALRDPGRPKTVRFQLARNEEVQRVRQFVEASRTNGESPDRNRNKKERNFELREVEFTSPGDLGIEFGTSMDSTSLVVSSFLQHESGIVFAAEKSGKVRIGDVLASINDQIVAGAPQNGSTRAIQLLEEFASLRPLILKFCDPFFHQVTITKVPSAPGVDNKGGPDELILEELQKANESRRIAVSGFKDVSGMAETSGILIGDHLVFVNGTPVGAGCRWLGIASTPALDEIYGTNGSWQ
jgi:hypothetical protein